MKQNTQYVRDLFSPPLKSNLVVSAAFVVAVNCWSVKVASRTQVTLTFIKMFALVLIIIPGVIALAKGRNIHLYWGFDNLIKQMAS